MVYPLAHHNVPHTPIGFAVKWISEVLHKHRDMDQLSFDEPGQRSSGIDKTSFSTATISGTPMSL